MFLSNFQVEEIYLSHNEITDEAALGLFKGIVSNPMYRKC